MRVNLTFVALFVARLFFISLLLVAMFTFLKETSLKPEKLGTHFSLKIGSELI